MSGVYQTKVMRPANLKGVAAVKESFEQAISDAEKDGISGEVTVTAMLRSGSIMSVRQNMSKTLPLPDVNK